MMALKLTGKVDGKDTKIGFNSDNKRTNIIDTIHEQKGYSQMLNHLKNKELPFNYAILIIFC